MAAPNSSAASNGGSDAAGAAPVPWARQPSQPEKHATKRVRQMVESLPNWEPTPPGEVLVRRHREI